jgi:PAS domain S-box-containing protein
MNNSQPIDGILTLHSQILDTVNQAVIATDLDGIIFYWNKFAEQLYGWTTAEAVGRNALELTPTESTLEQAQEIMSNLSQGKTWSGEFVVQRKGGAEFPIQITNSPIYNDRRHLIGVAGFSVDITERKQSEKILRESEERFRVIVKQATAGISETDLSGNFILVNQKFCQMLGYTETELLKMNISDITHPEDLPHCLELVERAIETGESFVNEKRLICKEGRIIIVNDSSAGIFDAQGKTQSVFAVAVDITEHKPGEKALREKEILEKIIIAQEDERRRIARDLHDHLGQQVTALRMKLETIKKMCQGDEKMCEEIDEAEKIAAYLDADVDFIAWELRPVSLEDLGLQKTLADFVRQWSRHTGVEAEFHTNGLGKYRLDFEIETNLYRIMQEALNNIYKHAKAKMVSVLLEKRKDLIVLIIEDDGIGFNLNDKNTKRKGLGLIGMNERAKISNGKLEIESTLKKGTSVFVRIPVAVSEATATVN